MLKDVPLQGPDSIQFFEPLKEVGPSTSIDPDFHMDEKKEKEVDYSHMFDISSSHGHSADPLPEDGSGPNLPSAKTSTASSNDNPPVTQS